MEMQQYCRKVQTIESISSSPVCISMYFLHNSTTLQPTPLVGLQIDATISSSCADVTLRQCFVNEEDCPIEAAYNFRQSPGSAIYSLQVHYDGRTYTARTLRKQKAQEKYDDTIANGFTAAYMEEKDHLTTSLCIGNLKPKQHVVVVVRYVAEAEVKGSGFLLRIPLGGMETALPVNQPRPPSSATAVAGGGDGDTFSGLVATATIRCPGGVGTVLSPTHAITTATTATTNLAGATARSSESVVVQLGAAAETARTHPDWVLVYAPSTPHVPHVIVEEFSESSTTTTTTTGASSSSSSSSTRDEPTRAICLSFLPEYDPAEPASNELIFVVDRSGSMSGARIQQTKAMLQFFMRSMSPGDRFNIYGFGTDFRALFDDGSRNYDDASLAEAMAYIHSIEADYGGTCLLPPLMDILPNPPPPPKDKHQRRVFCLTDGEVGNDDEVLKYVRDSCGDTRVFAFGVGSEASVSLVKGLADAGNGIAEFVHESERVEDKVLKQLQRALKRELTDVRVDWGGLRFFGKQGTPVATAGRAFYLGDCLRLYGLVEPDRRSKSHGRDESRPYEVTLEGTLGTTKIRHVTTVDLRRISQRGTTLHRLAAKDTILRLERQQEEQEAQKDLRSRKSYLEDDIVALATRYHLLSKYTAFVIEDIRGDPNKSSSSTGKAMMVRTVDAEQIKLAAEVRQFEQRLKDRDAARGGSFCGTKSKHDALIGQLRTVSRQRYLMKREVLHDAFDLVRDEEELLFGGDSKRQKEEQAQIVRPHTFLPSRPNVRLGLGASPLAQQKKQQPSLPPPSPSSSSSSEDDKLLQLVGLQTASGYWELTDQLCAHVGSGVTVDRLRGILKGAGWPAALAGNERQVELVWATCLALAVLQVRYSGVIARWQLLAEKANKWLAGACPNLAEPRAAATFLIT